MKTMMLVCSLITAGAVAGKAARQYMAGQAFMGDSNFGITGAGSDGAFTGKISLPNRMSSGEERVEGVLAWWDEQAGPDDMGLALLE